MSDNSVTTINFKCKGQLLTVPLMRTIASGGINNVKCHFNFDESWNGLSKTAVFTSDQPYPQELDNNDECFIPAFAMMDAGRIEIAVYGTFGDEIRQTSTVMQYEIKQGSEVTVEDIIANIKLEAFTEIKSDIIATLSQIYTDYEIVDVPNFEDMTINELVNDLISNTTMIVDGLSRERISEQTKTAIVDTLNRIAEYYRIDTTDYTESSLFEVIGAVPDTLNSIVSSTLNQANDKDVYELSQALHTLTDEDFSALDFDGLIEAVKAIPIITPEITQAVADWDAIKSAIENSKFIPKELWDNGNRIDFPYSVPYLNTAKMTEGGHLVNFNANLESVGFDLTSAPQNWLTSNHTTRNTPFYTAAALKFVKITGCESQNSFIDVFLNRTNLEEVELYGVNKNHTLTNTFSNVFSGCTSLHTVSGEPLDMTDVSSAYNAFYRCTELANIRFKPDSISTDISFANSPNLTQESVLSIINGLSHPSKKISLSSVTKANLSAWKCDYGEGGLLEVSDSSDAMTFQFAITQKGWTIA